MDPGGSVFASDVMTEIVVNGGCNDIYISGYAVLCGRSGRACDQDIGIGKIIAGICKKGHQILSGIHFTCSGKEESNTVFIIDLAAFSCVADFIDFAALAVFLIIELGLTRLISGNGADFKFRQDEDIDIYRFFRNFFFPFLDHLIGIIFPSVA
jgi:hypothetical protein